MIVLICTLKKITWEVEHFAICLLTHSISSYVKYLPIYLWGACFSDECFRKHSRSSFFIFEAFIFIHWLFSFWLHFSMYKVSNFYVTKSIELQFLISSKLRRLTSVQRSAKYSILFNSIYFIIDLRLIKINGINRNNSIFPQMANQFSHYSILNDLSLLCCVVRTVLALNEVIYSMWFYFCKRGHGRWCEHRDRRPQYPVPNCQREETRMSSSWS